MMESLSADGVIVYPRGFSSRARSARSYLGGCSRVCKKI
jgi:hypothetical protein